MDEQSQHKEAMGRKYGLQGRVLDRAHSIAWEERHAYGLYQVEDLFEDIADVVNEADAARLPVIQ